MSFVGGALDLHARARARETAIRIGEQIMSWAELRDQAAQIASALAIETGDRARIAVDVRSPRDFAIAFLGIARSGRTAVILDPAWTADQRETVLTTLEPAITLDKAWLEKTEGQGTQAPSPPEPDAETPLFIGFTSGSTGTPKGYERTHASWLASVASANQEFKIGPEDRVCLPGSLNFSLFLYAFVHAMEVGASVRLFPKFAPKAISRALRADKSTVMFAVPTQARMIIDAADNSLPYLRLILSSGAKWAHTLSADQRATIPNADVLEFYGASELSFVTFGRIADGEPSNSVGRPFPDVEIVIRDADGTDLAPGETGSIWVKSAMTFTRYVLGEGPECKVDGDFMTVGDRGFLDAEGRLHLAGREARMLVSAGENVFPEIIEARLRTHPAVLEAAVIGLEDDLRGQKIAAALSLEGGQDRPTARDLIRHCAAELGERGVPRHYYEVVDWPVHPSGKTDNRRIGDIIAAGDATPVD